MSANTFFTFILYYSLITIYTGKLRQIYFTDFVLYLQLLQQQIQNMLSIILLSILTTILPTATSSKLDTLSKNSLTTSEQLTSALGYYKLKLLNNCSLQLHAFSLDTNQYKIANTFNPGVTGLGQCNSLNLSLVNQSIVNSEGKVYRRPGNLNNQYYRFKLKVNDIGSVDFVAYYKGADNQVLYNIDNLHTEPQKPQSQFQYHPQQQFTYTNENNWTFSNDIESQLLVYKDLNNGLLATLLKATGFQFLQSGITDADGQTRYAILPGIQMKSKAGGNSCGSVYQGAFIQLDRFWPIARIYDQDGVKVGQYLYDQLSDYVCPDGLFAFKGDCVASCPLPYYAQIQDKSGICLLNCQTNYIKNEITRSCSDSSLDLKSVNLNKYLNRPCPPGSTQSALSCICPAPLVYNSSSNKCEQRCQQKQLNISGTCIRCPQKCLNCEINRKQRISFISCINCSSLYSGQMCQIPASVCQSINNCNQCQVVNGKQRCKKCKSFYTLTSNQDKCLYLCAGDEVLAVGVEGEGYCVKVPNGSSNNDFISVVLAGIPQLIRKSGTCLQGQMIFRDKCVLTCPQGTEMNSDRRCICNPGFATFSNSTCSLISQLSSNNLGSYYNSTLNTFLNCPINCLSCDSTTCFKCSPGHILVLTSTGSACRQENIYFNCQSQFYTYDSTNKLCLGNNIMKASSNITNCKIQFKGRCLACANGYFLFQLACVNKCKEGYSEAEGRCVLNPVGCQRVEMVAAQTITVFNNTVLDSPIYKIYSSNRMQISNDPFTEILSIRDQLGIPLPQSVVATRYYPKINCKVKVGEQLPQPTLPKPSPNSLCNTADKPYQLLNGTCINNCLPGTYVYRSPKSVSALCLTFTKCYLKNPQTPLQMPDGSCAAQCPSGMIHTQFGNGSTVQCITLTTCQQINIMTPYQLENTQCASACPSGTAPKMMQDGVNLKCIKTSQQNVPKKINIDSSVFELSNEANQKRNLFYFVIDHALSISDINVNYYKYKSDRLQPMLSQTRISQQPPASNIDLTQIQDKTYLAITTAADQIILDFSKNIKQFSTPSGNRLASSIYGVHANENRIHNTRSWLAIIAYVLSILLIILHAIYVGNHLIYKIDNLLIFAQVLYFFSFVHLLINASVGQFYYGFFWAHFGFFPNYFAATIPPGYMEGFIRNKNANNYDLPNSYRLLTGDANFIRNAGFSFSLLATFIAAFVVICLVILLIKKVCGKYQIWHKRIAKSALIAAFQFVSINIFYWAVAHLLCNRQNLFSGYDGQSPNFVAFRTSCSAAAIVWICIYGIYMILRFVKNKIGGLYMFKRIVLATILAASAYHNNGDGGYKLFLIPLVFAELVFVLLRFILQEPYLKRQKIFILVEAILMIIAYFTIYLWNDTGFVSIFVSLVFFFFIFLFTSDLMDVYLDNKDEYYDDEVKILPGLRQKQDLNKKQYQQINNAGGSLPESDRRFRNQQARQQ